MGGVDARWMIDGLGRIGVHEGGAQIAIGFTDGAYRWGGFLADDFERLFGRREPHTLPPQLREGFTRLRRVKPSRRWKDSLRHPPSSIAVYLKGRGLCPWGAFGRRLVIVEAPGDGEVSG